VTVLIQLRVGLFLLYFLTGQNVLEKKTYAHISVLKINSVSITVLCVIGSFKFLLYFYFENIFVLVSVFISFHISFSFYFRFRV